MKTNVEQLVALLDGPCELPPESKPPEPDLLLFFKEGVRLVFPDPATITAYALLIGALAKLIEVFRKR